MPKRNALFVVVDWHEAMDQRFLVFCAFGLVHRPSDVRNHR